MFGGAKIAESASHWVRLWGNVPDPDLADQSPSDHVYVVDQIAAPPCGA